MLFGHLLLWGALVAGIAALGIRAWSLRSDDPRLQTWFRRSATATAFLLGTAFILLCILFLVVDVSVQYVWTYTATWVEWPYRLAGAWTGREGSLLLWTGFTAAVLAVLAHRHRTSDDGDESTARAWTELVMAGLLVAFLVAVARSGLFDSTDTFLLTGRPFGNGFNPLLVNPYILIHPPMMFLAYALTIVPAASGISHMVTGTGQWSRIAGRTSRVNWVLYTFAMGLGGLWAYYTLGFGGYWAWDPVEVANLLPWLALTVYLHAQMMHARRGWFAGIGPMLGVLPFLLTVFSTVSTRSGLWVSVHAFTDPTNAFNPDAAARLLGILGVDESLLPYFGLLLGTYLLALALWCRRLALDHDVLPRVSRVIAAVLALVGGMAWVAPAGVLALAFNVGALFDAPGLGALGLLAVATLAAAAPSLVGADDGTEASTKGKKGWRRFVEVPQLAALSVLLLSLLLVVSLMWHFGAVNGWSESFWDARIPWLLTPVALALTVLMLRGRGRKNAVVAAGALLAASVAAFVIGGIGYYAVLLAGGLLLATVDKVKAMGFLGERPLRWRGFFLWTAAVLDLVFWVDPPTRILGGLVAVSWPIHLLMIPLSVLAIVGAHLVGLGRQLRWPFVLTALLGGFYVAPLLVAVAAVLRRTDLPPQRPFVWARVRPLAIYGVHFAVAVLMLGYAASTYFETTDTHVVQGSEDTFQLAGATYNVTFPGMIPGGALTIPVHVSAGNGPTASGVDATLQWEPQNGAYRSMPAVLRQWDQDVYVVLDAVCVAQLDAAGQCPESGWLQANTPTGAPLARVDPTAARLTVHSLPGINMVWAGLGLFVIYGVPVAWMADAQAVHRTQRSRPTKAPS